MSRVWNGSNCQNTFRLRLGWVPSLTAALVVGGSTIFWVIRNMGRADHTKILCLLYPFAVASTVSSSSVSVDTIVEIDIPPRVGFVALVRMIVAAAATSMESLDGERLDDLRWLTSEATTNAIEANLANIGQCGALHGFENGDVENGDVENGDVGGDEAEKEGAAEVEVAVEPPGVDVFSGALEGEGRVRIVCEVLADGVAIQVSDQGEGLVERPDVPDITHPDRLLIEGGFGLPLIEELSSEVDFASAESGTTVRIEVKRRD